MNIYRGERGSSGRRVGNYGGRLVIASAPLSHDDNLFRGPENQVSHPLVDMIQQQFDSPATKLKTTPPGDRDVEPKTSLRKARGTGPVRQPRRLCLRCLGVLCLVSNMPELMSPAHRHLDHLLQPCPVSPAPVGEATVMTADWQAGGMTICLPAGT